jgi:hypothetical protein
VCVFLIRGNSVHVLRPSKVSQAEVLVYTEYFMSSHTQRAVNSVRVPVAGCVSKYENSRIRGQGEFVTTGNGGKCEPVAW